MTVAARRSRQDLALGRFLRIGQIYRERDTGDLWTVRQVHRADCELELIPCWVDGRPVLVAFADLRASWVWIANTPHQEAPAA